MRRLVLFAALAIVLSGPIYPSGSLVQADPNVEGLYLLPARCESKKDAIVRICNNRVFALCTVPTVEMDQDSGRWSLYSLYDLSSGDSTVVRVPQETGYRYWFTAFTVLDSKLYLADLTAILVFGRNDRTWELEETLSLGHTFMGSRFFPGEVVVWNFIKATFNPRTTQFYSMSVDLGSGVNSAVEDYVEPKNAALTYLLPRASLGCNQSFCALSDITEYVVTVHGSATGTSTIRRTPPTWIQGFHQAFTIDTSKSLQVAFPGLVRKARSSALLDAVHVANDGRILVYWSSPTEGGRRYYYLDRWVHDGTEWVAVSTDLKVYPASTSNSFSLEDVGLSPGHQFDGEYFFDFRSYPGTSLERVTWSSYQEYVREIDKYSLDANPRIVVRVTPCTTF